MRNPVDLSRVRTIPIQSRANKVALERFAKPPVAGRSFADFIASLPNILGGEDFREIVQAIVRAIQNRRPVIVGMGAHVIKVGLTPIILDLMRRGIVTGVALNGAGAIHDFELAMIGETSEDVAQGLKDGSFGMARETGELINQGINRVLQERERGLGDLLGEHLLGLKAPRLEYSLLAMGHRLQVPVTVHVAVGTDIIHMHPSADGAALGLATFNDFRIFTTVVSELSGGVYLNIGSSVLLPEVFLKAFTIAQNLDADLKDFTTVNLDMLTHYRATENVVRRPPQVGGQGYSLIGRHELLVPLLAQAVIETLETA